MSADRPIPSKRFGQHFLRDKRTIQRIIEALAPSSDETIVEIGPGTGALTAQLIERAGRVIAVEFDNKLAPLLTEQFGSFPNFKLVMADALTTDFCREIEPAQQARLVANLPYNISTAILQRLIEQRACVTEMVVMLQREVVERIMAPAGSSERGFLSVLMEAYCEIEKLFDVGPGAFQPPPKVWSSVIRMRFRPRMNTDVTDEDLLWKTVSAGFAQKRKTILNNLRNVTGRLADVLKRNGGASIVLCKAGVELKRRAETLTIEEWGRIVRAME
ncbi:MAG TPA: 16S rRNA (adenine(1518)-N(6)/adenine(1519)-N(6))-dimethyltransferase RsmA [Pyrinomonadaceae bacterium]|nr:16S rRNA (adenine(1518)-N(6)/adenine(1519)-N(6))-dimethyltransferase RsmA [Pyrinomonadaceae bacterium]